ncbi:MAG: hypothetical protein K5866_05805 [Treponema sp.]|nr:hypothetical protein [Treponema sp.]
MKDFRIIKNCSFLFIFALLLFTSCNQLVSQKVNNFTSQENSSDLKDFKSCSININISSCNNSDRRIYTADAESLTVAKYNVIAQADGHETINEDFTSNEVSLDLAYGVKWTITVNAYEDDDKAKLILQGESTFTPSSENTSLDLPIYTLTDSSYGKGYYSYSFVFPNGSYADTFKVSYKLDNAASFSEEESVSKGGTYTLSNLDGEAISAGQHTLTLKIDSYLDGVKQASVLNELTLIICVNATANKYRDSENIVDSYTDGTISFTEEELGLGIVSSPKASNISVTFLDVLSKECSASFTPSFDPDDDEQSYTLNCNNYPASTVYITVSLTQAGQECIIETSDDSVMKPSFTTTVKSTSNTGVQELLIKIEGSTIGNQTFTITIKNPDKTSSTSYILEYKIIL